MLPNLELAKLNAMEIDTITYHSAIGSLLYTIIGMALNLTHAVSYSKRKRVAVMNWGLETEVCWEDQGKYRRMYGDL